MPSENFLLKSRLQALKRSGLSEDVFIAILLCLISTNKHLILTARSEDMDDLRNMTEQILLIVFGLTCSTITCEPSQTLADFTSSLFARSRDDASIATHSAEDNGGLHRMSRQKSYRSIRTASSTSLTTDARGYEGKTSEGRSRRRKSNYSHVSGASNQQSRDSKELENVEIMGVASEIQVEVENRYYSSSETETEETTEPRDRIKSADQTNSFTRNPILTNARRRDNNFPPSSSTSSMSSFTNSETPYIPSLTSSPFPSHSYSLRPDLSQRNHTTHHPSYNSQPQLPLSPMDFTISKSKRRHDSIVTSGGSNPPSPFLFAKHIAQAVIIERLDEGDEEIQFFLLETIIKKRFCYRKESHSLPKPFIVIVLLPTTEERLNLPNQLLDRFFISYEYENDTSRLPANGMYRGEPIKLMEIKELEKKIDKVSVHNDMQRYMRDIVVGLRMHRLIKGGITARTSRDFEKLAKAVAVIFDRSFITPDLILITAEKVFAHRLILREPVDDRSLMYGTKRMSLLRAKMEDSWGFNVRDVVADVLQVVRPPV
ncbi:5355_t:CDS:2 [Paraglomus occultum]|uniref:magnesium chelatase n=1 Tax=Paraglomus occultum TaxID=144539 RepID=A0A9N9FCN8_9GLOM|nr:5355_t:CDS:2 [Paraglomus occultum]